MIEFLKRLFGQTGSSATAKERLRLVLMTDHLELAPDMIEAMKRDLVNVISTYVEVDREKIEVNFERQDRALAMLANIPILSVNRPTPNGAQKHEEPAPVTAAASATAASGKPPVRRRRRRATKKTPSSAPAPSGATAPATAAAQ